MKYSFGKSLLHFRKPYRTVKPLYHFEDIFPPEFQKEQRYIFAALSTITSVML